MVIVKTQDVLRVTLFLTLDKFINTMTYSSSLMTDMLDKSSGMPWAMVTKKTMTGKTDHSLILLCD